MINGSVILGCLLLFQKLFHRIPGNSQNSGCCSFGFCLLVHSVHSCPVFQIFHLFFSPFRTLWAYEKDFIFHKEVGQFYVLNFQGTVYIRNGITYSLPLIGGSTFLVNPGSFLIINQQHVSRFARIVSIV